MSDTIEGGLSTARVVPSLDFASETINDLKASGLIPSDLKIRPLGEGERHVVSLPTNVQGYVIPYFDINGKAIPFYRVKSFDTEARYKQPTGTANHIYFPPGFSALVADDFKKAVCKAIIITEGEKKAACAVKHGFPAVAVSGVYSWKSRTIKVPKDTQILQDKEGNLSLRVPAGTELDEGETHLSTSATGLHELIELAKDEDVPLVLIFDSDCLDKSKGKHKNKLPIKEEVQIAIAQLGYALRSKNLPLAQIKQLILRPTGHMDPHAKLGIDDFLVSHETAPKAFLNRMNQVLASTREFPRHPDPRTYVTKRLRAGSLNRDSMSGLAISVLSDLDSKGRRLYCPNNDILYYFDNDNHSLIPVSFYIREGFDRSPFGRHLYKDYGLTINDNRFIGVLASQYSGEEPCDHVYPEKVIASRGDYLYIQLGSGKLAKISGNTFEVLPNGSDNILFESDQVRDIDDVSLIDHVGKMQTLAHRKEGFMPNQWYDVLKDARIVDSEEDQTRKLLSLLYYLSPWLYRWRGTQLPVEMMLGEPGSGKSSLYTLRLMILTGIVRLRNAPKSMADWVASVSATGGLHVTDNVHMSNNDLRQQLSDEMCRVITEPEPMIEQRKLYTNVDSVYTPVQTVFAVTALKQPFINADIVQRAIIAELDKGTDEVSYEGDWPMIQLERFGGREAWLANQLVFLQQLLKLVETKWNKGYKAKYRLINLEQLFMLAAEVFGWESAWIPDYLSNSQRELVAGADETLAGLKAWVEHWAEDQGHGYNNERAQFCARDIAEWATFEEDWKKRHILTSSRSLGKYIEGNKNMVAQITGIQKYVVRGNRAYFYVALPQSK